MNASVFRTTLALVALACFASVATAQTPKMGPDQSPATNPVDASYANEQQRQQVIQPLNNQPVWSEVRSGTPQFTSLPGRETNVLIQPEGQTWRALRNSQVSVYAGWGLVAMVLIIAAFYFWKGTMQLHEPPTGRRIRRFTNWQMAIHSTTAYAFVTLAITGLIIVFGKNVLLPVIGYTLFGWLTALSKNLHNFVAPIFIVSVAAMIVLYVRYNLPKAYDLKFLLNAVAVMAKGKHIASGKFNGGEKVWFWGGVVVLSIVVTWSGLILLFFTFLRDNLPRAYDWAWIRHFGGIFSGRDVPSGKFNAGEKLWFWTGLLAAGLIVSVTGFILDFPNFNQTRNTMQIANIVHLIIASLFMLAALGHIYMGTLGMAGAYNAMSKGYVDETWAKEHHLYWYNDIKAGKVPTAPETEPVPPVAVPHPAAR